MSPTAMLTLIFAALRDVRVVREPPLAAAADRRARRAGSTTSARACAEPGGTRFARRRWTTTTRPGCAHKLIFTGFVVLLAAHARALGPRVLPAVQPLGARAASQPLGAIYEFVKDCVATGVVVGTLVFFYYRLVEQAEAHDAVARGPAHRRHHLHDDGRRHDLRRRVARRSRRKQVAFCDAATPRSATADAVRGDRDHRRAARRRALSHGEWSFWPGPGGLALRARCSTRARPATLVVARARRVLDALDAGPALSEPAAALEALPRHHGDPERLPRSLQPAGRLRADGRERREADGEVSARRPRRPTR